MAAKPKPKTGGGGRDAAPEKWRILIFMATETESLIEPAKADLLELLTVRNTDSLAIRVQVHGLQLEPPQSQGSRRYRIRNRHLWWTTFHGTGGAGGKALQDFVCDGVKDLAPETRLLVILWGHAQGVGEGIQGGLNAAGPSASRVAPFAYAGASNQEVVSSLAEALKCLPENWPTERERRIDLLVFDSCFMAAAEVVTEFQEVASYIVASQTTVDLPGLQLASVLRAARRTNNPAMLGREIIGHATIASSKIGALSLFRPPMAGIPADSHGKGEIENLFDPFCDLSRELDAAVRDPAAARLVFESFHDARSRDVRQFLDLANLARRLSRIPIEALAKAAGRLREALHPSPHGFLVEVVDKTPKPRYGGVGIYCPWFRASRAELQAGQGDAIVRDSDYAVLRLVQKTAWGRLMLALAPAWELAHADGVASCVRRCPCCGCGSQPTQVHTFPQDVRTGGPKEPNLGQSDSDD